MDSFPQWFSLIYAVSVLLDSFSFYHGNSRSQCTSPDVVEFIENTIEHSKSGQFMFFIRSNIPGTRPFTFLFHRCQSPRFRSTDDTCSSLVSCLTFSLYVLVKTHRPVCHSSSNPSRSYRWTWSARSIETILKRTTDLYGKVANRWWKLIVRSKQCLEHIHIHIHLHTRTFIYVYFFLSLSLFCE